MDSRYIFTSLTRISSLPDGNFQVKPLPKEQWETGDYVVCSVEKPRNVLKIELVNGRMADAGLGDLLVGVFGIRSATMEATGTWEAVGNDHMMHVLTGAGLFGKMTSRSTLLPDLIPIKYRGHVHINGRKQRMRNFLKPLPKKKYRTPTVVIVGSSMSAGKTTVARIIIRQFKMAGLSVLGAKLTGAGRYRDVLSMHDAGADWIYDFVDAGLPSTICDEKDYVDSMTPVFSHMAAKHADLAVIEIGASPLEPYNGRKAVELISGNVQCSVLCASDPYAVHGIMNAFHFKPDIVTGPATNTQAGIALIDKLCHVYSLNLIDPKTTSDLRKILARKLNISFETGALR